MHFRSICLVAALTFTLAACGGSDDEGDDKGSTGASAAQIGETCDTFAASVRKAQATADQCQTILDNWFWEGDASTCASKLSGCGEGSLDDLLTVAGCLDTLPSECSSSNLLTTFMPVAEVCKNLLDDVKTDCGGSSAGGKTAAEACAAMSKGVDKLFDSACQVIAEVLEEEGLGRITASECIEIVDETCVQSDWAGIGKFGDCLSKLDQCTVNNLETWYGQMESCWEFFLDTSDDCFGE